MEALYRVANRFGALLKTLVRIILLLVVAGLGYLNLALYYQPKFKTEKTGTYNESVYHQLQFLKTSLAEGAGTEMQNAFPEGFVFINVIYGLAWARVIENLETKAPVFQEGLAAIQWSLAQIDSPQGRSGFPETLTPRYGIFYNAWYNYLLGRKLALIPSADRNPKELEVFQNNCAAMVAAFEASPTPFLSSYLEQSWPADNVVAVAAINVHDQILPARYQGFRRTWINRVKEKLDPRTQLIPHAVDARTGRWTEGARGSSQSLMLNFLVEIDAPFAKKQFLIYQDLFLAYRLGLPGIREYPKAQQGRGDVDSGPVIWGIGASASIVGQSVFAKMQLSEPYFGLRNSIEAFGAAYTQGKSKKYLWGHLPMADAFIAWSNAMEQSVELPAVTQPWRLHFQLLTLVVGLILLYLVWSI